ncbi:MAG: imidazolonepropionase [Thermomicrobiales bacterium]|jgi:imidazolonepropionase|nr:imidazolonepropionase [Thermomicrobiales bacterium]
MVAESQVEGVPITLFVDNLDGLVTPAGDGPVRGLAMARLEHHAPAAIAVSGRWIVAAGSREEVRRRVRVDQATTVVDGTGTIAVPGLIDCHTHPVFLGHRTEDFELRARGASYEEIHAAGGGIRTTVAATRAADDAALVAATEHHLAAMLRHGTLTAEVKSGYGLDRDTEVRSLRAAEHAGRTQPVEVVTTFLGAHTMPAEYDDGDAYLDYLVAEVLPAVTPHAKAADIFVERGGFSVDQARRYLAECARAGLALRIHGDQFSEIGAIPLAIELGARSVDHLEATGPEGVQLLAESGVAAVLLPISSLFLRRPYPPARALIDAGAIVALATDFNPGSAYCESLPLAMNLACAQMGLAPAEALVACTVNAAHVIGRGDQLGRLRSGYQADVLLLDAPDWRYLAYHLAGDHIVLRIKAGMPLDSWPSKERR